MQMTFYKYLKVRVCLELGRPCMRAHVSTSRRRCASCCTDRGGLDDAVQFSLLIGRELASPSASYYFFAALDCFTRIVTGFEGKRLKYFVCFCDKSAVLCKISFHSTDYCYHIVPQSQNIYCYRLLLYLQDVIR